MKKIILLAAFAVALTASCKKFDDSAIWDKLDNHEQRIESLEEACKQLNKEVADLQTIVTALEKSDYITTAAPLASEDGYSLVFKSGKSIVIYNGKDGKDSVAPTVGVKKDTDGIYYWTIDGNWLIADGNKVKASATDGSNGITPKFKIEEEYWFVSYNNGGSWERLGKAQGNDGLAGENGDSLFKGVFVEDGCVCFEMNDEENNIIRLPLMKDGELKLHIEKEGTLSSVISLEESRSTTHLCLSGNINVNDMRYLQTMPNLQILDLKDAVHAGSLIINPYLDTLINNTISEITLPKSDFSYMADLSYCLSLKKVNIASDFVSFGAIGIKRYSMEFCPNVVEFEYLEGVTKYTTTYYSSWKTNSSLQSVIFPSTISEIPLGFFHPISFKDTDYTSSINIRTHKIACKKFVCKAVLPPDINAPTSLYLESYKGYRVNNTIYALDLPEDAVLYVPAESVELYKTAHVWENFTNIQAIPEEEL